MSTRSVFRGYTSVKPEILAQIGKQGYVKNEPWTQGTYVIGSGQTPPNPRYYTVQPIEKPKENKININGSAAKYCPTCGQRIQ